eukprot:Nk52_evm8s292 gene=Nk52_evmTU8s292
MPVAAQVPEESSEIQITVDDLQAEIDRIDSLKKRNTSHMVTRAALVEKLTTLRRSSTASTASTALTPAGSNAGGPIADPRPANVKLDCVTRRKIFAGYKDTVTLEYNSEWNPKTTSSKLNSFFHRLEEMFLTEQVTDEEAKVYFLIRALLGDDAATLRASLLTTYSTFESAKGHVCEELLQLNGARAAALKDIAELKMITLV